MKPLFPVLPILLLSLLPSCAGPALGHRSDSRLRRGLWVTRWEYGSASDVRSIVANAAAAGFDHLLFQVRGRGDAFYRSRLEPWSEQLGGKDPGFDPLALAVKEGRARGLAVHAWINVVPGWGGDRPPRSSSHLWFTHPEWFLTTRDGRLQPLRKGGYMGLNVCLPEVRRYLVELCRDLVGRYDLAGLHLDYIRFMEPEKGRDFPYDKKTLGLFARETGVAHPDRDRPRWDAWRRECLDRLVCEIRDTVKSVDPRMLLSAAVLADFDKALRLGQDARRWARMGWVDCLYPMIYERRDRGRFLSRVTAWVALQRRYGVPVRVGIGSWLHLDEPRTSVDFFKIARDLDASGVAIFSASALFPTARQREAGEGEARDRLRQALEPCLLGPRWYQVDRW